MADYEVTTTEKDFRSIVVENDDEFYEDPTVYEFSNGRKFKCTDKSDSGVYS